MSINEPAQKPVLLFVEDEALLRLTIGEDLVDAGFTVLEAGDATEALKVLSTDAHVDLLFTDIRMPGAINGWDLASRARTIRPDLPVIFATGYSDNVVQSLPGSRLLRKPYRMSAVLATARDLGVVATPDGGEII